MTDQDVESLVHSFEDGTLPRSEWTHARHLLVALWYIRRHGGDAAVSLIRDGIGRYNERHGNRTGYHETITLAWVAVIDQFLAVRDRSLPVSVLAGKLLEQCGDKDFLLRFYSRERLHSHEARARWVPPDREEITTATRRGPAVGVERGRMVVGEGEGEGRSTESKP